MNENNNLKRGARAFDFGTSLKGSSTLDFKLTPNLDGFNGPNPGQDNDFITAATITLNGNITINFTDIGGIATGTPYVLLFASSQLGGDPTFTFNVPDGYAMDPDYGFFQGTDGYVYDTVGGTLSAGVAQLTIGSRLPSPA